MEIKRKIARIFLLSAILMLIMNNVLPHHHHHEEVCFATSHCSDSDADHHDAADHNAVEHEHHNGETGFCQLVNFYLAPDGQKLTGKIKYNFKKDVSEYAYPMHEIVILVLTTQSNYNFFIVDQLGFGTKCLIRALRAPPIC